MACPFTIKYLACTPVRNLLIIACNILEIIYFKSIYALAFFHGGIYLAAIYSAANNNF